MNAIQKWNDEVHVMVRPSYSLDGNNPFPVAFLWVNGDIHDWYPCGIARRRIQWLPIWFPFNCLYDYSLEAQVRVVHRLRELGERLKEKVS